MLGGLFDIIFVVVNFLACFEISEFMERFFTAEYLYTHTYKYTPTMYDNLLYGLLIRF